MYAEGSAGAGGSFPHTETGLSSLPPELQRTIGLYSTRAGHLPIDIDNTIYESSTRQVLRLTVRYNRLRERGTESLCRIITDVESYPHLSSFTFEPSLSGHLPPELYKEYGSKLAVCFGRQHRVRELRFKTGQYDMSNFVNPIVYAALPSLQILSLSFCPQNTLMEHLKDHAPMLEELAIAIDGSQEDTYRLTTELVRLGRIRKLALNIRDFVPEMIGMLVAFHDMPNLTDLTLNVPDWEVLSQLAEAVFTNVHLKCLKIEDLSNTPVLEDANHILEQLSKNRNLKTLDLQNTGLFTSSCANYRSQPGTAAFRTSAIFVKLVEKLTHLIHIRHVVFGCLNLDMMMSLENNSGWIRSLDSLDMTVPVLGADGRTAFYKNVFSVWGNRPGLSLNLHHFKTATTGDFLVWPSKKGWEL